MDDLPPNMQLPLLPAIPAEPVKPHGLRAMHAVYGVAEGKTCGGCIHLIRYQQASTWFKCGLSRQTGGAATDWRLKWPACGKYEEAADAR